MNKIFQKARTAELTLESLTQDERRDLNPFIEEIKAVQRQIDALLIQFDVADKCKNCLIGCCTPGIEEFLTEYYFYFLFYQLSDEAKYDIWKILQKNNSAEFCRFLAKNGCIIPTDARPYVCDAYSEKFDDAIYNFEMKLSRMGYRLF
jgi:hypothetical protein